MITVDINIIVRLFIQDDAEQFQKVRRLITSNEIFIADSVILEYEWVLLFAWHLQGLDIADAFHLAFS